MSSVAKIAGSVKLISSVPGIWVVSQVAVSIRTGFFRISVLEKFAVGILHACCAEREFWDGKT